MENQQSQTETKCKLFRHYYYIHIVLYMTHHSKGNVLEEYV